MPTKNITTKLLTVEGLIPVINKALSTSFTKRSVLNLRQAGRIPYTRIGYRTLRYDASKVLAALTRNEIRAIGDK